jgi:hypothetical protein
MVIELSFQDRTGVRKKVKVVVGFTSIEEMIREDPGLLTLIIDQAKVGSELLEKIKVLDR